MIGGGGDRQVVGEQRAGAVVLLAVEPEAAGSIGQQPGVEHQAAHRQAALLAERIRKQLAGGDLLQPPLGHLVAGVGPQRAQPLLDEPEVRPEDVGDNGIGLRYLDQRRKQLAHGVTGTTELRGQPKRAEAGPFERGHLIEGVLVVEITVFGARRDVGEQGGEFFGTRQQGLPDGCMSHIRSSTDITAARHCLRSPRIQPHRPFYYYP